MNIGMLCMNTDMLCMNIGMLRMNIDMLCMHVGIVSSINAIDMLEILCMLNLTQITPHIGVIHARILQGSNASILQYYNVCKILALYCARILQYGF